MLAVGRLLIRVEPFMGEADMARPIDQHRGWHIADLILGRDRACAVVNDRERDPHFAEEHVGLRP